jgi:chromosome segregation protein
MTQKAELAACDRRAAGIVTDIQSWQSRMSAAADRQSALSTRRAQAEQAIAQLQSRPAAIEEERRALMTQLGSAEGTRKAATDKLVAAETKLTECERQLKKDEEALMTARENRVRAEGGVAAAQHLMGELTARMAEKLDATPDMLLAIAGIEDGAELPPAQQLDEQLTRMVRERDAMGPVNLRADVEAEALIGELDRVRTERDDLTSAISKLRQGIHELNTEARTRLNEAFEKVNEHFQDLFVRLFGGGRAHLQMIEAEDPLETGLEIFASPPGKKLQVLSLLSGGEKALTATALLFAVFMCNPSPICVLDEVDAPLDESNVGRFCDMVEEIARALKVRFLIVTHHRLTMARMDRLYGVTMQERGVSSLMSVDLATAERFREAPSAASAESKAA